MLTDILKYSIYDTSWSISPGLMYKIGPWTIGGFLKIQKQNIKISKSVKLHLSDPWPHLNSYPYGGGNSRLNVWMQKGHAPCAPPVCPNSFIFFQFSANILQNNSLLHSPRQLASSWKILDRPLIGNNKCPFTSQKSAKNLDILFCP